MVSVQLGGSVHTLGGIWFATEAECVSWIRRELPRPDGVTTGQMEDKAMTFNEHIAAAESCLADGAEAVRKISHAEHAEDRDDYGKQAMGCWAQASAHAAVAQAMASGAALGLLGESTP
jgi:hypothetical protein